MIFIQKIKNPIEELKEFPLLPKKLRELIVNIFGKDNLVTSLAKNFYSFLKKLSFNGLYLDFYGKKVLVDTSKSFSRFIAVSIDQLLIDGSVNSLAKIPVYIGRQMKPLQSGYVRSYLSMFGLMTILLIALLILSSVGSL